MSKRSKKSIVSKVAETDKAPPAVTPPKQAESAAQPSPPAAKAAPLPAGDALDADFTGDLPPGAQCGSFSPTVRDRWADQQIDLPDGEHTGASGWKYMIAGGRFIGARFVLPAKG